MLTGKIMSNIFWDVVLIRANSFDFSVPLVLKCCSAFIEEMGIVDGIYRLSGITSNIQKLRLVHSLLSNHLSWIAIKSKKTKKQKQNCKKCITGRDTLSDTLKSHPLLIVFCWRQTCFWWGSSSWPNRRDIPTRHSLHQLTAQDVLQGTPQSSADLPALRQVCCKSTSLQVFNAWYRLSWDEVHLE